MLNTTEIVKYDFTLEIGDTYDFSPRYFCTFPGISIFGPFEVVDVTNEFIAGENRKVIEFDYLRPFTQENERWMEGIGSISGFDSIGEDIDNTNGTSLVCFDIAGTNYFFNNATSCDNTTLGIDDLDRDQIILYPNPVTSISILQFPSEGIVALLKIYNITGKLIKEEKVDKDYVLIDAMQYPSGLYFYQVLSEKKLLKTEKFIIR